MRIDLCDILKLFAKTDLSAKAYYAPAYIFHHPTELVGADVGLCPGAYLLGSAQLYQLFKHITAKGIVYPCGELSVGEGACAALAELDIGLITRGLYPCSARARAQNIPAGPKPVTTTLPGTLLVDITGSKPLCATGERSLFLLHRERSSFSSSRHT